MSDSNCVICLEQLSHPVGAVNPCGHCFHEQCFREWHHSKQRRGEATRCPMCNIGAQAIQRIFIHLPYDNDDNDDDCISLSSSSSVENSEEGNDHQPTMKSDKPKARRFNDERNVIGNIDAIDCANSPAVKHRRARQNSDSEDANKYKRRAKRLKKRVKMLESQRKEFVEKERKITQQNLEARERLTAIDSEFNLMKAQINENKLELEHKRMEVVRTRADYNAVKASLDATARKARSLEVELAKLQQNFHHSLSQAQAHSMAEAQLLKEQHHQLGDENNKLKQLVVSKENEIRDLQQKLQRMQTLLQGKVDVSMQNSASNSRRRAAMVGKSLLEEENRLLCQQAEEDRLRSMTRHERVEVHNRMKSKLSHQAARLSVAVGKKHALHDKHANVPAEAANEGAHGNGSFHRNARDGVESKLPSKNPTAKAPVMPSVSLNLSSTNKRIRVTASVKTSLTRTFSVPPPHARDQGRKKTQSTITTMFGVKSPPS